MRDHVRLLVLLLTAPLVTSAAQVRAATTCGNRDLGPRAECQRITVWENRAAKSGRKIDVVFAVLRAASPGGGDAVFMFAGGPGQGSTEMAGLANGPFAPVRQARDIVLVDQRGTGGSNGLTCVHDVVADPQSAFGHVFDPVLFRNCLAGYDPHADLRFYTSELAAQDVDDIRAALGYDHIVVWGGSYGTRLAQTYMRDFPTHVSAAVLDGVVPFDFRAPIGYAATAQQSLERVFADCRADAGCNAAHPNVDKAFARVLQRFDHGPIQATVRRPDSTSVPVRMSLGDFGYAVRGILYNARASSRLPAMIDRADSAGNVNEFATAYWGRAANFAGSAFADGLHFAIFCAEDVPYITDGEIAEKTRGTFLGRYLIDEYRGVCGEWVRAPLSPRARDAVQGDIPTLLLSGWFDPVTPPETAERVAKGLRHSRHLIVRNEAHGAGAGCALQATLYVLREAKIDGLPAVCEGVTGMKFGKG